MLLSCCFLLLACGGDDMPLNIDRALKKVEATAKPQDLQQADKQDKLAAMAMDEIRVGLILPLSGEAATVGNAILDAVTLAMADVKDPRIHLFPVDSLGTEAGGQAAANQLSAHAVNIVIGPLFSDAVRGAKTVLTPLNVPIISLSNNRQVAGDGTYILGFTPDVEVTRIIQYAFKQGLENFAALIPDNAYGFEAVDAFGMAVNNQDGNIMAIQNYQQSADQFNDPVKAIADYDRRHKAYNDEVRFLRRLNDDFADDILKDYAHRETIGEVSFDALLIPEGGALLKSIAPVLPFYEIDPQKVKFLGTGLWDDDSLLREPALQNAWFSGVPRAGILEFNQRFQTLFQYLPPRVATLAYDAAALVATLAREPNRAIRFSRQQFENPNGFKGYTGSFRLTAEGLTERLLAVMEITEDGIQLLEPALDSFEPLRQYVSQNTIQQGPTPRR